MTDNNEKVIPNVNSKSKEERNVPDLRFDNTIWKKYKYNEVLSIISNKNKLGLNYKILSASQQFGMVDQNTLDLNIKRESTNYSTWKNIEPGDYVIHLRSFQGGYAFTKEKGICCPAYTILRPKNDLLSYGFLEYYFTSKKFINSLTPFIYGIRDGKSIMISDWLNTCCYLPSVDNQIKIYTFIQKINERISTQKKIINNLESLINTIKNKIFNNEVCISKTPLKDILIEINRKSTVNNQFPVISSTVKGLVLQSEYFDKEIASENNIGYKIISKDNIIISPQNLWMGNITYNDKFENGIVSPSYKIFNIFEKYNGKYIFEMLTTKKAFYYYKTVSEQGASVVRRNLNYEAFMELMFNVPPKETQDHNIKILESYNDKLTNEKKILLAYEKQKQYLLNHMFI